MSVESSREAFLLALERLLSRSDSSAPGINAVAREAALNKVLIYRYFGTWDGLLEAFAQRVNPWRDLRRAASQGFAEGRWARLPDFMKWLFRAYLDALFDSRLLQNILIRSLRSRDPLQLAMEKDREEEGRALLVSAASVFPESVLDDPAAATALLIGGITWLVTSGTQVGVFSGLIFQGPHADARERLGRAIDAWVDRLTYQPDRTSL